MTRVDKKIPFVAVRKGRHETYPWSALEVGDSFLYDKPIKNARAACCNAQYRFKGRLFRARIHNGNVRIWRIK